MRRVKKSMVSVVGLIAFLFFSPLEIAHSLWSKFVLKQDIVISSSFIKQVYAVVLTTVEEALSSLLSGAREIKEEIKVLSQEQKKSIADRVGIKLDPVLDREFHFFIGRDNGYVIGYAVKGTVKGKWGPIHYILSLDPEGKILDVMVLEYSERRGRPIAKRRFLKQFVGKTIEDRIKLKKDIRGISGASISSRGMTDGIRKLVYIFNEFYAKNIYPQK